MESHDSTDYILDGDTLKLFYVEQLGKYVYRYRIMFTDAGFDLEDFRGDTTYLREFHYLGNENMNIDSLAKMCEW